MTDTTQDQDATAGELPDAHELFPDKLPDADELYPDKTPYGQMRQHVSPVQDMIFSNPGRSHARILDAFGYGFKQNWGAGGQEFSEADEALKKAGIYNDYAKGQHSIIKAANEAVMRPAVAALIAGKSALSGVFAGGQAAVAQAGAEVGAPNVGRELAAIPEAFPAGFHQAMGIPHAPLPPLIEQAKSLDVIGAGEDGYFGTRPVVAEPAAAEVAKPAGVSAKEWNETILGQKPEGEAPSPVVQAMPEAAPTEAAAMPSETAAQAPEAPAAAVEQAPDIHTVARQIAPETFHEFDALAQKKDTFRRWIGELREVRDETARQNAPHADEIADLEERLKDATPRLAKKYQTKLDPLIAERDAYVADKTQGDSADMAKIRQQLMQADYRMRDLAGDVSKAYRDAEARMPQAAPAETVAPEAPAAAVVAPVPAPETVIEGTNKASEVAGKQAVAPAEPTQAEPETVTTSPSDVTPKLPIAHAPSIVADVSQKLKAAGRPAEEADAAAQIVAAYWETRAQRFEGIKGTAAEMYAAEAPDIKAGKEKQPARQLELAQLTKGRIRLRGDGRSTITLMKNADASTFIHETGHEWLERMLDDARDEQAPAELRNDATTVLKWLGVDSPDGIKTRHHEKFARGFETYMMEGRAPSSALARVFAKFKDWLTTIYRTAASLKASISDDIRGVFDRLLAEKPEKTVIAPERETKGGLGPRHEPLVESTPPEKAHEVANTIETERDSQIDRNLLETKDNDTRLADTGTEAEGRAARSAQPSSDADAAGPVGSEAGAPGGSGEVGGRGSETAAEGAQPRQKSERLDRTPLLNFIASQGGIKASDALISDLRQSLGGKNHFIPGLGQLIRAPRQLSSAAKASGRLEAMSLDRAREAAIEAGLLHQGASITNLLDAIDDEVRGTGKVRQINADEQAHAEHNFVEGLNDSLKKAGGAELSDAERARALELYHKEGLHDPAAIIERLALEADDEETASGAPERIEGVPGWDVPAPGWDVFDERPAASGAGEGAAPARAGQPGSGTARAGGEAQEPVTATEPFLRADTHVIDKAGNIRLENINAPEDIKQVLRESANRNNGFIAERRAVISDSEALALAQALGEDPAFLDRKAIGSAYTKEEIFALEGLLIKSATAVRDAMAGTDEIAYAEAKARHLMVHDVVQAKASGARAEAGRALQAFAALKRMEGAQDAEALQDWLKVNSGMTLYQAQQEMKYGSKLKTPSQVAGFINDSSKNNFHDRIVYYYINNLISGPITHLRYAIGNELNALWKPLVEIPTAAAVGAIKQAAGIESESRVYLGEAGAQLHALTKGSRDGLSAAIQAYQDGVSPALPGERVSAHFAEYRQPIPGTIGYAIGVPGRSVAAIHSFFKQVRYEQEIQSLAYRQAMKDGLSGDDFAGRIAELTTRPTEEMMEKATGTALKELFMAPTDYHSAMGSLTRAINSNLLAKIIVPFMKIGSQITRNAFIERTPLGLASKDVRATLGEGGAEADMQIAKMATGVALIGATTMMAAEGLATGDGPTEPKARAIWLLNHRPNSITIGGVTMPYQGLGHLGMLMRFSANMYETAHFWDGEDGGKLAVAGFEGLTKSVLDENFLRGVKDMLDAVYHSQEYGMSYIRNNLTNWIPFSVGLSQLARKVDPYQRETHTIFEAARAKIPFVSQGLFPRRDRFGEPIPNGAPLPQYQNDPVVQTMERLNLGISAVPKKIRGVELTEQQYDDYSRIAGRTTKMLLNAFVNTPGISQMPDQVVRDKIRDRVETAREMARGMLMMQPDSSIMEDARQKKIAPLLKAPVH